MRVDTGVEFDVDGIACETATLSLQLLLFCTVVDVAVIAARATVCANVWAVPVGDETISSSAVVLAVDAFVDVRSMTYPAGLRPRTEKVKRAVNRAVNRAMNRAMNRAVNTAVNTAINTAVNTRANRTVTVD